MDILSPDNICKAKDSSGVLDASRNKETIIIKIRQIIFFISYLSIKIK
jgi:hypothetical protein